MTLEEYVVSGRKAAQLNGDDSKFLPARIEHASRVHFAHERVARPDSSKDLLPPISLLLKSVMGDS